MIMGVEIENGHVTLTTTLLWVVCHPKLVYDTAWSRQILFTGKLYLITLLKVFSPPYAGT